MHATGDWRPPRSEWSLDQGIAHLNHGSFGAVPRRVLAVQQRWRDAAERNPTRFHWRTLPAEMARVRERVAGFVGAHVHRCVLVPNVTAAMATVLASVPLDSDDELLVTADTYPAVHAAALACCLRTGARLVVAQLPAAALDGESVAGAVLDRVTSRTRLAIVDHITSPTALLVDIAGLVDALRDRGVVVAVDGAHAPGCVPVDVDTIDADFYAGNFHKWCCAPRGAAFLTVRPGWAPRMVPSVAGARLDEGFPSGLEWWGTTDYSALLCVPAALELFDSLGWERAQQHNRDLVTAGMATACAALGLPAPAAAQVGMAAVLLDTARTADSARAIREDLAARGVEVAVPHARGAAYLRISAHLYNEPEEYALLAELLSTVAPPRPAGTVL